MAENSMYATLSPELRQLPSCARLYLFQDEVSSSVAV
jgi:hypothetical protein